MGNSNRVAESLWRERRALSLAGGFVRIPTPRGTSSAFPLQRGRRREKQRGDEDEREPHGRLSFLIAEETSAIFAPPLTKIGFGTSVVMTLSSWS